MVRTIDFQQTLFFYDVPMLFYGIDVVGCNYLCLLVHDGNDGEDYICTPISKTRLKDFFKGIIDLRVIFENPEIKEFYKCKIRDLHEPIAISFFASEDLPESYLPEKGLYLSDKEEINEEIVDTAKEFNKPVLYASLYPPESKFENKIIADRLSNFLNVFQNVVKYAYKKTCKTISPNRVSLDIEDAHKLQVFGFAGGSFTIKFEALDAGDLFGSCGIEYSLERIDQIIEAVGDKEKSLKILRENKGHLVSAYIHLLKFISENNTSLEYRWATPVFKKSKKRRLSQKDAEPLLEYLTTTEDISSEQIILVGKIIRADEKNNTWKIFNDEDQKEYAGKIKEGTNLSLKGVVIGTIKYKFICEEIIEEILGTGKEKKIIQLVKYIKIDN